MWCTRSALGIGPRIISGFVAFRSAKDDTYRSADPGNPRELVGSIRCPPPPAGFDAGIPGEKDAAFAPRKATLIDRPILAIRGNSWDRSAVRHPPPGLTSGFPVRKHASFAERKATLDAFWRMTVAEGVRHVPPHSENRL